MNEKIMDRVDAFQQAVQFQDRLRALGPKESLRLLRITDLEAPWNEASALRIALMTDQELKALRFERHLKTNACRLFLRRYFADDE